MSKETTSKRVLPAGTVTTSVIEGGLSPTRLLSMLCSRQVYETKTGNDMDNGTTLDRDINKAICSTVITAKRRTGSN